MDIKMNQIKQIFLGGLFLGLISCGAEIEAPKTTIPKTKKIASIKAEKGKGLFLEHCATCHNIDMLSDMTGPALYGVEKRWHHDREGLIAFIQNPQELINSNHERAVEVAALWPSEMTAFPQLTSEDIGEILAFIAEKGTESK